MIRLFTRNEHDLVSIEGDIEIPQWVRSAYTNFSSTLTDKQQIFPCYIGTLAHELGSLRYTFIEKHEFENPSLHTSLRRFLSLTQQIGGRPALVAFVDRPEYTRTDDYAKDFWSLLQCLHNKDVGTWPNDMPTDPNDPSWHFYFDNVPIFVTGHCPTYKNRKSRFADVLTLVIQPISNLAGLIDKSRHAVNVQERIRSLVEVYDQIPLSPVFGQIGDAATHDWRQFWLADNNDTGISEPCPLSIIRNTRILKDA